MVHIPDSLAGVPIPAPPHPCAHVVSNEVKGCPVCFCSLAMEHGIISCSLFYSVFCSSLLHRVSFLMVSQGSLVREDRRKSLSEESCDFTAQDMDTFEVIFGSKQRRYQC